MHKKELLDTIRISLDMLKEDYLKKFMIPIFDVHIQIQNQPEEIIVLERDVLLIIQKKAVFEVLEKFWRQKILDNLKIISNYENDDSSLKVLVLPKNALINLYRLPVATETKNLSHQISPDFLPFRILKRCRYWDLTQMADGTIGWIKRSDLRGITFGDYSKQLPQKFTGDKMAFQTLCEKYIGTSYHLGGGSLKGIDCSALSQRIIYEAFSLLLPKKSADQRKMLKNRKAPVFLHPSFFEIGLLKKYLDFTKAKDFGGLIFLKGKSEICNAHVAIWYDKSKGLVIHSSKRKKGVRIEEYKKVRRRYEVW